MIPKTIHKVIIVDDGKLPELPDGMKKSIETFYRMNPGYKVNIFSIIIMTNPTIFQR